MKLLAFSLLVLGLIQSCDPYGFGFKKNPAYVLDEAFEAVMSQDFDRLGKVAAKEAICLYGNRDGINYLRSHLNIDSEKIDIKPKLLANLTQATPVPEFVGYWSYYHETYNVEIMDKATKEKILMVLVQCDYGFEGKKKPEYTQITNKKKYKIKECRVTKLMPVKFAGLPVQGECVNLRVNFL